MQASGGLAAWHAAAAIWRHTMIEQFHQWINDLNGPLWNGLVYLLLGTGPSLHPRHRCGAGALVWAQHQRNARRAQSRRRPTASRRFRRLPRGLPAAWAWAISPAWRLPCRWRPGRGVLDVGNGADRHELGFCRIIAGAAFQGARPQKRPIFEAAPPITSPKASAALAGRGVCNQPDFDFRLCV